MKILDASDRAQLEVMNYSLYYGLSLSNKYLIYLIFYNAFYKRNARLSDANGIFSAKGLFGALFAPQSLCKKG
jgi:hypothetical protein